MIPASCIMEADEPEPPPRATRSPLFRASQSPRQCRAPLPAAHSSHVSTASPALTWTASTLRPSSASRGTRSAFAAVPSARRQRSSTIMEGTPISGSSTTSVSLRLFARGSERSSGGMGETEEIATRRTLRRGCKGAHNGDLENHLCRITGTKELEFFREELTLMTSLQQCYPLYQDFSVPVTVLLSKTIAWLRDTNNLLLSTIQTANRFLSTKQNKTPAAVYESKNAIL
jgi:hypothetical protein